MSLIEGAKKLAAYKAVTDNLGNSRIIGIGSGSTVVYVAEKIGLLANKLQFICIPTGFQSKQLIIDNGLALGTIEQYPELDIAFDGADECDPNLNLIKGGGACLLQEKLVADAAKVFIVVADYRKKSPQYLGTNWRKGVPIEVVPNSWVNVSRKLKQLGASTITLRDGAGAKAGPIITDNNNFLLDADFGKISDPSSLHANIKSIVGVVETGLFTNMANKAYFGEENGTVTSI